MRKRIGPPVSTFDAQAKRMREEEAMTASSASASPLTSNHSNTLGASASPLAAHTHTPVAFSLNLPGGFQFCLPSTQTTTTQLAQNQQEQKQNNQQTNAASIASSGPETPLMPTQTAETTAMKTPDSIPVASSSLSLASSIPPPSSPFRFNLFNQWGRNTVPCSLFTSPAYLNYITPYLGLSNYDFHSSVDCVWSPALQSLVPESLHAAISLRLLSVASSGSDANNQLGQLASECTYRLHGKKEGRVIVLHNSYVASKGNLANMSTVDLAAVTPLQYNLHDQFKLKQFIVDGPWATGQ